jgi:hypothetical protein
MVAGIRFAFYFLQAISIIDRLTSLADVWSSPIPGRSNASTKWPAAFRSDQPGSNIECTPCDFNVHQPYARGTPKDCLDCMHSYTDFQGYDAVVPAEVIDLW